MAKTFLNVRGTTGRRVSGRHEATEASILSSLGWKVGSLRGREGGASLLAGHGDPKKAARRAAFNSMRGRSALEKKAVAALKEVVKNLPYNFGLALAGWVDGVAAQNAAIEQTARICGWVQAVATRPECHRTLVRMLGRLGSPRGMNSPANNLAYDDLTVIAGHYSPGAANRIAAKVVRRADQILSPYGLRVSWTSIREVLRDGGRRVGKMAHRAAELTAREILQKEGLQVVGVPDGTIKILRGYTRKDCRPIYSAEGQTALMVLRGHADWRRLDKVHQEWCIDQVASGEFVSLREAMSAMGRLRYDNTDGVEAVADPTCERRFSGVVVTPVWLTQEVSSRSRSWTEARKGYVVRAGDRTFHALRAWPGDVLDHRTAVVRAREAWTKQDAAARQEAELEQLLLGTDPRGSVLIYRRHSYAAGNCSPGTAAWISRMGLDTRREFLPLPTVWRHAVASGEQRALNACRTAAREALRQLAG